MKSLCWTLVLLILVVFAAPARAADVEAQLRAAETAYDELEFEKALDLASGVVTQRGLNHDQLIRAYRVLGRTQAVLDQESAARESFVALLTYSTEEREDRNLPPKVTARWLEARGVLARYAEKPGIDVGTTLKAQTSGTLRITTRDPTRIAARALVGYRWGGTGQYSTTPVAIGRAIPIEIPAPPANVLRLDYYVQAFDARDNAVFEFGTPTAPRTAFASKPVAQAPVRAKSESRSLLEQPVFWLIAGGVVAGAGTAVFFATRGEDDEPPRTMNLTPALFCGADNRCR